MTEEKKEEKKTIRFTFTEDSLSEFIKMMRNKPKGSCNAYCADNAHPSAGWNGPDRKTQAEARKDAKKHKDDTKHTDVGVFCI